MVLILDGFCSRYHSTLRFCNLTDPSLIFLMISCLSSLLKSVGWACWLTYPGMGKLYISTSSNESWWVQKTRTTRVAPFSRGGLKELQDCWMVMLSFLLKLPGRVAPVLQLPSMDSSGLEQMKRTSSRPAHLQAFFSLIVAVHLKGRGSLCTSQSLTVPITLSPTSWHRTGYASTRAASETSNTTKTSQYFISEQQIIDLNHQTIQSIRVITIKSHRFEGRPGECLLLFIRDFGLLA